MSVKDGYALQLAVKKKYRIVVISGGNGLGAAYACKNWVFIHIFLNVKDKMASARRFFNSPSAKLDGNIVYGR